MNNLKSRLQRRIRNLGLDIDETCKWKKQILPHALPKFVNVNCITYPISHHVLDIMKIGNYRGRF